MQKNGNGARKARCARFARDCAHFWCRIPKPNAPISVLKSQKQLFYAGKHSNSARAARCACFARHCARCVHRIAKSLFRIVGTIVPVAHTDFRANRPLLATTFWGQTANSCKPPTKLHPFYCGPYGPKLKLSFVIKFVPLIFIFVIWHRGVLVLWFYFLKMSCGRKKLDF